MPSSSCNTLVTYRRCVLQFCVCFARTNHGQTFVSASGYASNRSKLNFPNSPSEFEPSRWLSHTPSSNDPGFQPNDATSPSAFNPFSLGPRRCLGRSLAYLEMRLILAHLIWTFDFEATESKENPWSWEQQKSWILWEKTPLIVRVRCKA